MFQIGMVCHSEECVLTCFRLALYNFAIPKPHVNYKVLKHKSLCKETKSMANLHLFVCLFVFQQKVEAYFKCNELKRHIVVCLRYDSLYTVLIWNMIRNAFFSERHTMPIGWHMFQNGTQHGITLLTQDKSPFYFFSKVHHIHLWIVSAPPMFSDLEHRSSYECNKVVSAFWVVLQEMPFCVQISLLSYFFQPFLFKFRCFLISFIKIIILTSELN